VEGTSVCPSRLAFIFETTDRICIKFGSGVYNTNEFNSAYIRPAYVNRKSVFVASEVFVLLECYAALS
jgi:hypothetical protein